MGDFPTTGGEAGTDDGGDEDGPAAEEGEEESDHSPDDDQDGDPDEPGLVAASADEATTTPGGMASEDITAPSDDLVGPAPGDPLHMIHSIPAATASENPFSTRPGDWVYEADDVSFNLSAAHRCLEETRRTVAALREGNRHRRGSGTDTSRSRSRQRSPRPDSDTADRRGVTRQIIHTVLYALSPQPPRVSPSGELLDPHPLMPGDVTRALCKPCALPVWKNPIPHAVTAQVVSGALACPAIHLLTFRLACQQLLRHQPYRYCCAAVFPLRKAWIALTTWIILCVRLASLLCIHLLRPYPGDGTCAHRAYPSECHMPERPRPHSRADVGDLGLPVHHQASPRPTTTSRLGPNSQGLTVLHLFLLLLCVIIQPACAGSGAEARVAVPAAGTAGGASTLPHTDFAPKPGSIPITPSPNPSSALKRCAKRSFKRACTRALTQGSTRYRGRTFRAHEVPETMRHSVPTHNPLPRMQQAPARGLRIFCWNAGGLGGGLYPELLTFLHNSQYDVAVILESKWQENMEFTTDQWSCVHSGCKTRKQAGVLILLHHRIAPPLNCDSSTFCRVVCCMYESLCQARIRGMCMLLGSTRKPSIPRPPPPNKDNKFGWLWTDVLPASQLEIPWPSWVTSTPH